MTGADNLIDARCAIVRLLVSHELSQLAARLCVSKRVIVNSFSANSNK